MITAVTALLLFIALRRKEFDFELSRPDYSKNWYLPLLSILIFIPIYLYAPPSGSHVSLDSQSMVHIILDASLPAVVFEEMLFRAMLWRFLKDLGCTNLLTFFVQAFLFWISHYQMLVVGHVFSFWIATPCISMILGYIVLRSKSVALSTISHYLYNCLIGFSGIG